MSFIAPAPTETITVNAKALHGLLCALRGPAHHLRELQVIANGSIAGLFGEEESTNPIGTLTKQMTEWHEAKRRGDVVQVERTTPIEGEFNAPPVLVAKAKGMYQALDGGMEVNGKPWDELSNLEKLPWVNRAAEVLNATPAPEPAKDKAKKLFNDCRIEQEAFEKRGVLNKLDMQQHPLHYLFLSSATAAARDWWNAGRDHAIGRMKAAFGDDMPDEPQKLIAKGWVDRPMVELTNYEGLLNLHARSDVLQLPEGTHRLYLHPRSEVQLIAKDKA